MKAIGYIRVSTDDQAREGVSLEAQEAKIRAWADLNGYSRVEAYVDAGLSGKRADNREGLQAALKAVSKGDALVVYSLSRLARSTRDTLSIADLLMKRDADLVSLSEKLDTTSAAGRMVFRMLAVLAEFERDQVSERTRTALAHLKSKQQRVGKIPFGFGLAADGRTLEPISREQEAIDRAKTLRLAGMTLRQIAGTLATEGFMARNGQVFVATQIQRMVAA